MRLIYSLGIYLFLGLIRFYSIFNLKARQWLRGRVGLFPEMEKQLKGARGVYWFHCASLGEFEQGRPLIERIKAAEPDRKILLTFFSPSGYEVRKNYPGADFVFYLPADTPSNARKFLDLVKPEALFFVKYEFWYNFLFEIGERKIPAYLVSGIFRPKQHFFKWYGAWFRKRLSCFKGFYLQDEASVNLLASIGYANAVKTGDTRFDRVAEIAASPQKLNVAESFADGFPLIIAGSTWERDDELLAGLNFRAGGYKLIIAPHEIDEESIERTMSRFSGMTLLRYTRATETNCREADVLVLDTMGMLSSLYQYGTIGYVGGGFGDGIHNILEAAVFGMPVVFGPNYDKFSEAVNLIREGGAFCIEDEAGLKKIFDEFSTDPAALHKASEISAEFVKKNKGACDRILSDLKRKN